MLSTLLDTDFYEIRPNCKNDLEWDSAPLLNKGNNFKSEDFALSLYVKASQLLFLPLLPSQAVCVIYWPRWQVIYFRPLLHPQMVWWPCALQWESGLGFICLSAFESVASWITLLCGDLEDILGIFILSYLCPHYQHNENHALLNMHGKFFKGVSANKCQDELLISESFSMLCKLCISHTIYMYIENIVLLIVNTQNSILYSSRF